MPTITDAICTSFKDEVLGGTHDLDTSGDTLKIAPHYPVKLLKIVELLHSWTLLM